MKKRHNKICIANIFLCIAIFFASCKANAGGTYIIGDNISIIEESSKSEYDDKIVLGDKIQNPFSLKSSRLLSTDEKPNYFYFRIRTISLEGLELIKAVCGDLNIIPYDLSSC